MIIEVEVILILKDLLDQEEIYDNLKKNNKNNKNNKNKKLSNHKQLKKITNHSYKMSCLTNSETPSSKEELEACSVFQDYSNYWIKTEKEQSILMVFLRCAGTLGLG